MFRMAETCRLSNNNIECTSSDSQDENHCVFHVICVFISLVTILADLTTDIIVLAEYSKDGRLYWAFGTLIFIIIPNIFTNIFSLRWYIKDQQFDLRYWITHFTLVGFLERYIIFLRKVLICKNVESIKTHKLIAQRNDLSLLHFLYVFIGTVPQIILQTYAIIIMQEDYHTKVFALTASISSVIWGSATYIYSVTNSNISANWVSLILRLTWHFGMLIARIHGIILSTIIFGIWTLLPLGLHWLAMTLWIVLQKTNFCPNKLEETLYNFVMGYIYCFCYINIREGHTRYRMMLFYTLMVSQNFGCLLLYILVIDIEMQRMIWSITAATCIIIGTCTGIPAMILYYRFFHSTGPIKWKNKPEDIELNNKAEINKSSNECQGSEPNQVRSFKGSRRIESGESNNPNASSSNQIQKKENNNADRKFLLDHWIARSGTPTFTSAPIGNNSINVSSVKINTVENTPQSFCQEDDQKYKSNKKKTICSPTELNLKLTTMDNLETSIDEITSNNLILHKRRGICSFDELRDGLSNLNLDICNIVSEDLMKIIKTDGFSVSQDTDSSNKKTSSDSIDMDLDLSFSDINSSDINTFNENIVQKLCLSALKNIKVGNQDADIENIQRIALDILKEMYSKKDRHKNEITADLFLSKPRDLDTPTETLSVHDYENICAVNIAREAWGLRSWNGYYDIENRLHDGSVFRDRRRDTLTSGSSEISSCISQEFKNAILAAPPFPRKVHTYSNVFVKFDRTNHDDYANTLVCHEDTFLAKPCSNDAGKDPNHLEPIMEELDDLGDIDLISKKRLNSESSLVATIDEIRKSTVNNSPRNVYHRREHLWDSPQFNSSVKIESNLKKALWKEPSKFNSSNTMESLPDKENNLNNMSSSSKFGSNKKELNLTNSSNFMHPQQMENSIIFNENTRRRQKSNSSNSKPQSKSSIYKLEPNYLDLANKDIDCLWRIVSNNSALAASTEDCSSSKLSSSLQSLIQKDITMPVVNSPSSKVYNVKKGLKNKPRRKFSILRERFEPRSCLSSDEEMLYRSNENLKHHSDPKPDGKNQFERDIDGMRSKISLDDITNDKSPSFDISDKLFTSGKTDSNILKNEQEKQSVFVKRVLNPPKNTKIKHKI